MSICNIQIPSCYKDKVLGMLDSLKSCDFKDYKDRFFITILAQGYNIDDYLSTYEFKDNIVIKYIDRLYKDTNLISYMKLRYLTQEASIECNRKFDYVMINDDDVLFKRDAFRRYSQGMDYLDMNSLCGGVTFKGFFGYSYYKEFVTPYSGFIFTNKGLMFRPESDGRIIPVELSELVGASEDNLLAFKKLRDGYYFASSFNTPTTITSLGSLVSDSHGTLSYDFNTLIDSYPNSTYSWIVNNIFDRNKLWKTWSDVRNWHVPVEINSTYEGLPDDAWLQPESVLCEVRAGKFSAKGKLKALIDEQLSNNENNN